MELVEGAQQVTEVFGRWPSFHDAEVVAIHIDREGADESLGPTVTLSVHAFEMTDEVDARGYYVLKNHVLVTIALYSTHVSYLEGFNTQNVLFGLHISKPSEPAEPDLGVQVDLEPSFGVAASFQCARVRVLSVQPYSPPGRAA